MFHDVMRMQANLQKLIQHIGCLVQINQFALEDETCFEPGMVGIVTGVKIICADVLHLYIDTRPFEAHNFPLMSSNYYDNNKEDHPANLTALEAGYWEDVNDYYIDGQTFPKQFDFHQKVWNGPVHSFLNPMETGEQVSTGLDKTVHSLCASEYELKCPKRHPLSADKLASARAALNVLNHTQGQAA